MTVITPKELSKTPRTAHLIRLGALTVSGIDELTCGHESNKYNLDTSIKFINYHHAVNQFQRFITFMIVKYYL